MALKSINNLKRFLVHYTINRNFITKIWSANNFLKLSVEPNKPIKSIKVFSAKKNDQEVNIEILFFNDNIMSDLISSGKTPPAEATPIMQ